MTDETTPDAVELLSALLGEMLDGLVVPPTEAIERRERLYRARNAILAERARHAEEVAEERRLKELKRQETVSLQGAVRKLMDQLEAEEARVASLRDQLRKVEGERAMWEKTASVLSGKLDSLRSLLPDVRACAEYVVANSAPAAALSKEHQVFRETARRILAALDSQGGEGE